MGAGITCDYPVNRQSWESGYMTWDCLWDHVAFPLQQAILGIWICDALAYLGLRQALLGITSATSNTADLGRWGLGLAGPTLATGSNRDLNI